MLVQFKNDREAAVALGVSEETLDRILGYIKGEDRPTLGDCPRCDGWGRWDDIMCSACGGTGDRVRSDNA